MDNHHFFMGKFTVSMANFNSKLVVYQRVPPNFHFMRNMSGKLWQTSGRFTLIFRQSHRAIAVNGSGTPRSVGNSAQHKALLWHQRMRMHQSTRQQSLGICISFGEISGSKKLWATRGSRSERPRERNLPSFGGFSLTPWPTRICRKEWKRQSMEIWWNLSTTLRYVSISSIWKLCSKVDDLHMWSYGNQRFSMVFCHYLRLSSFKKALIHPEITSNHIKSPASMRNPSPSGSATFSALAALAARLDGDRVRFHRPIAVSALRSSLTASSHQQLASYRSAIATFHMVFPTCLGKWCPKLSKII